MQKYSDKKSVSKAIFKKTAESRHWKEANDIDVKLIKNGGNEL